MKVHANILDQILDRPTRNSKTASANIGDAFLDAETRGMSHGRGAWSNKNAGVVSGDNALSDAVNAMTSKKAKTAKVASLAKFKSVGEAVKFAQSIVPTKGAKLSSKGQERVSAVRRAGARLAYLLSRTAAQMKQDGATKLADYLNAEKFPRQAKQINSDLTLLQNVRALQMSQAKNAKVTESDDDVIKERSLGDVNPAAYVKGLLNDGYTPKQVEEKIEKMAELQGFSRSIATDALKQNAGTVGYAFLEPNHYMNDCTSTAERMNTKLGGVRAKSVRQIKACKGCQNFRKDAAGAKTCSLYRLPIVANEKELLPIINNLTAGAKNKRAALIRLANREDSHHQPKIAKSETSVFSRTTKKAHVRPAKSAISKKAASFTAVDVLALHNAGQKLSSIYAHGMKIVGPVEARVAVKKFVAGLKGSKTKIALTQIDCTNLGSKLSSSNAIYGEKKCGSCTYRRNAHCGLTGGTLVSYPGMDMAKTNHRIASNSPVDGISMIEEFDMLAPQIPTDIEFLKPGEDVDLSGFSKVDL
jgi:hypothetical protein